MSDFVDGFWSVYVTLITLASVVGCGVFLWTQNRVKALPPGVAPELKDHVWDEDLQEYNSPLPNWWRWLFYITVVFALGYLAVYPGLGSHPGSFGWSSRGQYVDEMKLADAAFMKEYGALLKQDVATVAADPKAREVGKRLFLTYCAQCHGSDARGAKGFPNLTDQDWLWGGEPEQIKTSILDGRQGVMPPHAHLGAETVKDLAHFVRSLSPDKLAHDSARAARGRAAFATAGCSGCHGPDAKGLHAVGAPNLTDPVWLYGSSEATVIETIGKGRSNKMPAHKDFLGEAKVHLLAAYVYGLAQGGTAKP